MFCLKSGSDRRKIAIKNDLKFHICYKLKAQSVSPIFMFITSDYAKYLNNASTLLDYLLLQ